MRTLAILFLLAAIVPSLVAKDPAVANEASAVLEVKRRGAELFSDTCSSCHGNVGEGVEGAYEKALIGDSSIGELTDVISNTMPEGDPESCVGDDARAIALYIHDEFYSPAARIRRNPPRKRLARLTAAQLRQSLADLYERFGNDIGYPNEKGIRARYYNRDNKDGKVEFDRTDYVIDFDFGSDGPGQGIKADNFAIDWKAGLIADESGRYELIVRSSCAFVCYLGDFEREFINNYVQSENRTEFRKTVNLTAGRVYPLAIELLQRKRKTEQPPATISLSWKKPHGEEQIIPARAFVKHAAPTFALQTKLPPDDRSYGYERGIAVDRQWDESTTAAAIEFADHLVADLWPKIEKRNKHLVNNNRDHLRGFLTELVETAFRGPVTGELKQLYIDDQIDATEDNAEAIKRVAMIALKSPRFLYPMLDQDRSKSQRAANRLSLVLHDSLPSDKWLLTEIKFNQLEQEYQVRDAAWRMVNDWRTRGKARRWLYEWLNLEDIDDVSKNAESFPEFNDALVSELRDSLDVFLDEVMWSESSDFRQLFQANWSFGSKAIGKFYGDNWEPAIEGKGLLRTRPDTENRFGVLSHPYLMSALAYRDSTSPIHRGVFLYRHVFGRTLRPPNEAFTPLSPDLHPNLTTRERVHLQTSPENCQVCHAKINGLGFLLENFDAVGRYQSEENGRAIDATGRYTSTSDEVAEFSGPADLAEYLVSSEEVQRAFVHRAFEHFVKQPPAAYGLDTEERLLESFRRDFNMRKLLVSIAVVAATDVTEESD